MPDSPLILQAVRFRARLDAASTRDLERLINAYTSLAGRLKDKIDLLVLQLEKMGIENITTGQVARMSRYTQLVNAIADELGKYGIYLETELGG